MQTTDRDDRATTALDRDTTAAVRTRPELLAPARDMDCIRAAVENGADAVYFGLQAGFNARDRAVNFTTQELPGLMAFLHRRGLRGYVTVNTLAFPSELPAVEALLRTIAQAGVDAVLVQDLGVLQLVRAVCPDLEIHASTQMTLTSAESIRVAAQLGVGRIVLARELSVDEIRLIRRQTDVPLEVFVHGALCVAYSGQCLTSESLGGRSANRGVCAQACRLPYELICDGQRLDLDQAKYLLSPQDLAAYALIPELLDAGVSALKIEGRLKTPEYVANITRHYREAIDTAVAGRPVKFTLQQIEDMELSFSRGFSPGWLHGCDHKMLVPGLSCAKRGVLLGQITRVLGQRIQVRLQRAIKPGDGVSFAGDRTKDEEQGGRVYEVFQGRQRLTEPVDRGLVELAFAHESIDFDRLWIGQQVWKSDDPALTRRLRKSFSGPDPQHRVPLTLQVRAAVGEPLRVTGQAASGARCDVQSAEPLQAARQHPATQELLETQFGRLGGSAYALGRLEAEICGAPMIPLSVLGLLRRQLVEQLDASAIAPRVRHVAPDGALEELRRTLRVSPPPERASQEAPEDSAGDGRSAPHPNPLPGAPGRGSQFSTAPHPEPLPGVPGRGSLCSAVPGEVGPALAAPQLHVLCRSLPQLEVALACQVSHLMVDFQDIREYGQAVALAHQAAAQIYLATPRIQKPHEMGLFRALLKHGADGILVRNLGGLSFFAKGGVPLVADFALNAANDLTVDFLRRQGAARVTASYDLNREQILDLVAATPPRWLEVVMHQHMPLFHMEHCVFCAVLSPGTNKTNCGRPCDQHQVELRDRIGMDHPLKADVGCRNTLFNAVPQSAAEVVPALLAAGVRDFRIELLNEGADEIPQILQLYRDLLADRITGKEVWRRLRAANRVGVTRGTLEERRDPLAIL